MARRSRLLSRFRLPVYSLAAAALIGSALTGPTAFATAGVTGSTSLSGSAGFVSEDMGSTAVDSPETIASTDAALSADRSHSSQDGAAIGATSQPKNVTTSSPNLVTSFNGLDHWQNRFASHGNQFSLEPPDQGLCVGTDSNGNTRVMEVINDVMAVYDTSGSILSGGGKATALNAFLGYAPAIVRSTHTRGPFVTDPSCLYDSGHWYFADLTLEVVASGPNAGHYTGVNHLDIAVSKTSDPSSSPSGWNLYKIYAQDDGTAGTPNHHCSGYAPGTAPSYVTNPNACFADFPHIGSDANGFYLTTNEYSFFGPEFHGAQVYAFSKSQLTSGGSITWAQFDTQNGDNFGFARNGFTIWPASGPAGGGSNGTEYFLSSNAGAEAHDTGDGTAPAQPSTQLLVWALSDTAKINTPSRLTLTSTEVDVNLYSTPPLSEQKSGPQPLRDCFNNNACSTFLIGIKDPYSERPGSLDSSDTRILTTEYVNGELWGALDTAVATSNGKQAGIEWFDVAPSNGRGGLTASLTNQGYLSLGNDNLTYPAIGLTGSGKGVMAFTLVGTDFYPSAGYALMDSNGPGDVHIAAAGLGPDDGFTQYAVESPFGNGVPRPRWGDYGAAVPFGSSVWIASEYIGQTCSFSDYENGTPFGWCGGTRSALANWYTRISNISAS